MHNINAFICIFSLTVCATRTCFADTEPEFSKTVSVRQPTTSSTKQSFSSFTGKILGNGVRVRLQPDVESPIMREFEKDDWLVVVDEVNDFYAIEAPTDLKAYVFRSFVLDNTVEGSKVNVRLLPDLSSPIIGHLNTGDKVDGTISQDNPKWLEIAPPKNARFYIAKEFVKNIGSPDLKITRDRKKQALDELMVKASKVSATEFAKSFDEIDFEKMIAHYQNVVQDYADFPDIVNQAKKKITDLQEGYLQKKLAYLESKASKLSKQLAVARQSNPAFDEIADTLDPAPSEKMQNWVSAEEELFLHWIAHHPARSWEEYYQEQRNQAQTITGVVEPYPPQIKNKPGDYVIRHRDAARAYIYSTKIDLDEVVGKYVTLYVAPRPNHNFAFPAYFVLDVDR